MTGEPTPAERSVHSRELKDRGIPSRPGNAGTYLGEVDVDGRRYAKFSAEPGTWVSSSMKTMGYDQVYPAKDGYGAYRGLVLGPNGKPLADPDRIAPGDQYLVPERTAPALHQCWRPTPRPGRSRSPSAHAPVGKVPRRRRAARNFEFFAEVASTISGRPIRAPRVTSRMSRASRRGSRP